VHATSETSLDLLLCDFGGSSCEALGLDGGHLPDDPFFDPAQGGKSTPATDIFGLGSIFYIILTGQWPHGGSEQFNSDEGWSKYQERVSELFARGEFPDLTNVIGGNVIMGCWKQSYDTVENVLSAIQKQMPDVILQEDQEPSSGADGQHRIHWNWDLLRRLRRVCGRIGVQ